LYSLASAVLEIRHPLILQSIAVLLLAAPAFASVTVEQEDIEPPAMASRAVPRAAVFGAGDGAEREGRRAA
jgi:hypothetical protein